MTVARNRGIHYTKCIDCGDDVMYIAKKGLINKRCHICLVRYHNVVKKAPDVKLEDKYIKRY